MRLDVYQAKVAAQKNLKDSGELDKLSSEEKRLVDKMVCSRRLNSTFADNYSCLDRFWTELARASLYQRHKGTN